MSKSKPKRPDAGGTIRRAVDAGRRRIADVLSTEYPAPFTIPVRQIWSHCYTTARETRAVYVLSDATWANQTAGTQAQVRDLQTAAYAALVGRHVRMRLAPMPVNPDQAAVAHIATAIDPAGDNGELLIDHVSAGAQRQREPWMRDVSVTVDVRLCGATNGDPDDSWEEQDAEIIARLSGAGLHAARAPTEYIDWLIRTSVAPGHNVARPGLRRPADTMAEYAEEVEWSAPPGPRMVKITHVDSDEPQYAVALTVSTMEDRDCPGGPPPWMSAVLALDFPVHLVVAGTVISAKDMAPRFSKRARWQGDQIDHQIKAGVQPDQSTYDTAEEARQLADQLTNGGAGPSVEWVGRIVVTGPTVDVCDDRARAAEKLFDVEQGITLLRERDQITALKELSPGVREIDRGFQRCSSVKLWARGVINVTGQIGQQTGMYLGYTSGRVPGRPVRFDLWYPTEVLRRAAIYPVLGDMGAGRSTLGLRGIQECILLGIPVVAIDPAGEWTNVDQLPGAAGRVQILDLSGRGAGTAGLLALNRIIPDPDPADFRDPDSGVTDIAELHAAREQARQLRVTNAIDSMRTIFDDDTWANEVRREAIKDAAWDSNGDLWAAVDWLNRPDEGRHTDPVSGKVTVTNPGGCEANRRLARELIAAAHGSARLPFPPRDRVDMTKTGGLLDAQVTIITMQGMQFPAPGSNPKHWTSAERGAALIMRLTAYLGRRLIEEHNRRSPRGRQLLLVDEAAWLANWDQGVAWISGFVRHTRRWNVALMLMSQHPDDLARLDPEGNVFASGGFAGWHDKPEPATGSLRLTGAPAGLEPVVTSLTLVPRLSEDDPGRVPGEFLFTDADGRTEEVRVDLGPYPELAAVADTSPGSRRPPTEAGVRFEGLPKRTAV